MKLLRILLLCSTAALFTACPEDEATQTPDAGQPAADASNTDQDAAVAAAPGNIEGTVALFGRDDQSGVEVQLEGGSRSTVTGADGAFAWSEVEAGNYFVRVSSEGFETERRAITLAAGATLTLPRVTLRVGRLILEDTSVMTLGFPPGSDSMVYLAGVDPMMMTGELHVFHPEAGDVALEREVPRSAIMPSPNMKLLAYGSDLAFLSGIGRIAVWDFQTHTAQAVAESAFLGALSFSPDSRVLITLTDFDTTTNSGTLVAYRASDATLTTIAEGVSVFGLQWSSAGHRLTFLRNVSMDLGAADLFVWDGESKTAKLMGEQISTGQLAPTSDLSAIVYRRAVDLSTGIGELWVRRLSEEAPEKLGDAACSFLRLDRAETHVLFASNCVQDDSGYQQGTLALFRLADGVKVELAAEVPPDLALFNAAETRIAYLHHAQLTTAPVGALGVFDLTTHQGSTTVGADAEYPVFSSDGAKVLFRSAVDPETLRGTLNVYDFRTGLASELAGDVNRHAMAFSPDNERVVYLTGMNEADYSGAALWLHALGAGSGRLVATNAAMGLMFSDGGERLAVLEDYTSEAQSGTLKVLDVASDSLVTLGSAVNLTGAIFSADGASLAFLQDLVPNACKGTLQVWSAGQATATAVAGEVACMEYRFVGPNAVLFKDQEAAMRLRYFDEEQSRAVGQNADFYSVYDDPRHGLLTWDSTSMMAPVVTMSAWDLAARTGMVVGERLGLPTRTVSGDGHRLVFLADYDGTSDTGRLVSFDLVGRQATTLGNGVFWAGTSFSADRSRVAFLAGFDRHSKTGTLTTARLGATPAPVAVDGFVSFPVAVAPDALGYVSKPPESPEAWTPGFYFAPVE